MAVSEEFRDVAQRINSLHNSQGSWAEHAKDRYPNWWLTLLTSLVLAIDSADAEEVRFVSSRLEADRFRIVVITPNFVIIGEVTEPENDGAGHSVKVARRSELESVVVSSSGRALGSDAFDVWPGEVRLVLHHPVVGEIPLPLNEDPLTNTQRDGLEKLLKELLQSLRQHR